MTTNECVRTEEWGAVLASDASDPRRLHVEACARCQAQRAAYLELSQDRDVPSGADPHAAAVTMRRAFEAELARDETASKSSRPARSPKSPGAAARIRDFFFTRPAFAAVAALATFMAVYVALVPPQRRAAHDVLRGDETETPARFDCSVETRGGALEFTWTAAPEADAYFVLLFDRDLREIHRVGPFAADVRSARVDLTEAPFALTPPRYAQVVAMAGAETVASSPVRRLDR